MKLMTFLLLVILLAGCGGSGSKNIEVSPSADLEVQNITIVNDYLAFELGDKVYRLNDGVQSLIGSIEANTNVSGFGEFIHNHYNLYDENGDKVDFDGSNFLGIEDGDELYYISNNKPYVLTKSLESLPVSAQRVVTDGEELRKFIKIERLEIIQIKVGSDTTTEVWFDGSLIERFEGRFYRVIATTSREYIFFQKEATSQLFMFSSITGILEELSMDANSGILNYSGSVIAQDSQNNIVILETITGVFEPLELPQYLESIFDTAKIGNNTYIASSSGLWVSTINGEYENLRN